MRLFHATPLDNKDSVIEGGLCLMVTDKITLADEQILEEGVFGFDNIESAHAFGEDCCGGDYAIFSFTSNENILDPEYDGDAVFSLDAKDVELIEVVD